MTSVGCCLNLWYNGSCIIVSAADIPREKLYHKLLPPPSIPKVNVVNIGSKMQRSRGTQGRGVKMKAEEPTTKKLPDKGPTPKPFAGRVFYLDIASRLVAEKLEKDIKDLGGTVEGFLSKEISCLITNKKEAKCTKSLKYSCCMPSPEPAHNSGTSSARPSGHRGCQDGGPSKKPEKEDVSRGKSLLKKVIKQQEFLPKNSILANALNWGVRILHLDDAKIYINQKKKSWQQVKKLKKSEKPNAPSKPVAKRPARQKVKAQKLKSPFIKVEDSSWCVVLIPKSFCPLSQYRPLYLVLPLFRSFQSTSSKCCRPVDKKSVAAQKGTETKQSLNKTWHGQDEGNISHNKFKEQKKRGYCECCLQKYDDLEAHLLSQQHKNYAQAPHYQDVDNLITSFEFDFVDWSKFNQMPQGSGLLLPAGTVQGEKEFPTQINQISPKHSPVSNLETGVVQETESTKPLDVAYTLVNNLVCHSEAMFTIPCPPPSLCSVTCVTDSFSKPPSSRVITPTHENVSPAEPMNILPDHNESAQEDLHLMVNDCKRLIDLELYETAQNDHNCLSEPVNFPSKKLKLDYSLDSLPLCSKTLETENVSALPPITKSSKDLEKTCPLRESDTLSHLPPSWPSSKLHRKVKQLERKARKPEELPCNSCKVSVPLEECNVSASKERLQCLFQSSDAHSEFHGFSCNSMYSLQCREDLEEQPSSHGNVLLSLFSNTGSSASTFNGF
ncbi:protein DBF4 homolog A isoform X2 [Rhinoderma darwinii]|uniref:protein DBF4 homolog A isoform X2 n=2 Tax=Rhinoderma darwinii TaxID=43563 RepID=UPI003F668AB9